MKFLPIKLKGQKVYAGFWKRFCAGWADAFIILPLALLFLWLQGFNRPLALMITIPSSILFAMYNVYFNARFGGTLGKLAVGIRITRPDGSKIKWAEAWKRSAVDLVFAFVVLIFEVWGLTQIDPSRYTSLGWTERTQLMQKYFPSWYVWITVLQQLWTWSEVFVLLFNKRKRAIHDFIAGTIVIKKEFTKQNIGKLVSKNTASDKSWVSKVTNIIKIVFLYSLLILAVLVFSFRIYMITNSKDIDPINDTDLLLVRPEISSENNAYPIFSSATNEFYLPDRSALEGYLWGDDWPSPAASENQVISILESNKFLSATIQAGVEKDFCFRNQKYQEHLASKFRHMNLVLLAKAKFLMEEGRMDEALETAQLSLRFGALIQKDAEYIVEAMIGIVIIKDSISYIEQIVDQDNLSADMIIRLINQLSELENLRTGLENGLKTEYSFAANEGMKLFSDAAQELYSRGFIKTITRKDYMFKPNTTRKMLAEHWRYHINTLNNSGEVNMQPYILEDKLPEGYFGNIIFWFKENALGKLYFTTSLINMGNTNKTIYRTEKRVSDLKDKLMLKQQSKKQK